MKITFLNKLQFRSPYRSEQLHMTNSLQIFYHSFLVKSENPFTLAYEGILEVPPRFELGNKGFADLCLTTWPWHLMK